MLLLLRIYDLLFVLILSPTLHFIYQSLLFLVCMLVCNCRRCFCLCLCSLLVPLYLSNVRVGVSVSSFCNYCWCFCAHLGLVSVPLFCSKLLLVPYCCSLAVILGLFGCLWSLLMPLLSLCLLWCSYGCV